MSVIYLSISLWSIEEERYILCTRQLQCDQHDTRFRLYFTREIRRSRTLFKVCQLLSTFLHQPWKVSNATKNQRTFHSHKFHFISQWIRNKWNFIRQTLTSSISLTMISFTLIIRIFDGQIEFYYSLLTLKIFKFYLASKNRWTFTPQTLSYFKRTISFISRRINGILFIR